MTPYVLLALICIFAASIVLCEVNSSWKSNLIGQQCSRGCISCSTVNGCLTCHARYFLLLQRKGFRQTGVCVRDCPHGFYQVITKDLQYCAKCIIENCQKCASLNNCTKCIPPFIEINGKCQRRCYNESDKDCVRVVDCKVGNWSDWGACSKKGKLCGYKYGFRIRVRQIDTPPSEQGKSCPATAEIQKCKMTHRVCSASVTNFSEYNNTLLKDDILKRHAKWQSMKLKKKDKLKSKKKRKRKKKNKQKIYKNKKGEIRSKTNRKRKKKIRPEELKDKKLRKALKVIKKMLQTNANHYVVKLRDKA